MSRRNIKFVGDSLKSGASKNPNFEPRKPPRENIRFGVNKGKKSKNRLVIDEHIQEATPEHLRIEIDKIFNEFLADPEKTEYIFPSDFNNLQRKYIHCKAQIMNLISKSHGKEPNRQLFLKKKPKQLESQSFQVSICDEIYTELQNFDKEYGHVEAQPHNYRAIKRNEKVYGKIQDSEPAVPQSGRIDRQMQQVRQNLPIYDKRDLVMESINKNQVTIISSETGSGKTTQIPQYILEYSSQHNLPCKIICTQPRRISTIAAAERVAYERSETVGDSVGYHIRLESKCGYHTNLLFCTVGVFLRNLMCGNKCLSNITHVIVDEIHERDKLSDFLLICLKQNLPLFPHLKVILMSATVDTTKFQEYFNSSAVLTIPGRLYPIQTYFLEEILSMTGFFTPQMRKAMNKLQEKQNTIENAVVTPVGQLSEQDQNNLDFALEAYMNFSEEYDYMVHYDEATADLLQLFISEDVPVDQQHSERGWTALMIACHLGDVEFIEKLCTLGANMNVADKLGKTAYDYAKMAERNNILQLLENLKEHEGINENAAPNLNDPQYLRQLYDMTTPDDFIDYELIVTLIQYIHAQSDRGSILIFLPGYDEIMQCNDRIINSELDSSAYRLFFLHSSMNMKDQCDVFKPLNKRKLILSTNIAETSITVEDVVFVLDVGKAKEKVFDSYNKLSALQTQWISRACAKQRQGRAGRVQAGFCFRLYSTQRYNHMAEERVPEILRVSLEEICLHAKIIAPRSMNIYNFLCLAPDPPTLNSVGVAIENLQSLGALDKEEDLTKLGEYLAQLTLEPRLGKMLIFGCIFKCLEPLLTLCAAMAHKDPFQLPPQANLRTLATAKRRELINGVPSDHSVYLLVFQKWQDHTTKGSSKQFCRDYFISESTMYSVLETRRQLLGQLRAVGFINKVHSIEEFNTNSKSWGLVKAIMSAAYFPNVAYPVQRGLALSTKNEKKLAIHNTSICASKKYNHWCFYDEMVKNKVSFMVRGVTLCTPLMISLMCGIDTVYPSSHSVNIDDWLEFYFGDTYAIKFRKAIHSLVDKCMMNPGHSFDQNNLIIIHTLRKVMDLSEKNEGFAEPTSVGQRPKFLHKVINESNAPKRYNSSNSKPITRDGMRQPPQANNYDAEWIESHKKGLTPKRYIPLHKKNITGNTNSARNLSFDNCSYSPSTSSANELVPAIRQLAVKTDPGLLLLKGLEVPEAAPYQQQNHSSSYYKNYQNQNNGHGYNNHNNFTGYNSQYRQNNSNPNNGYYSGNNANERNTGESSNNGVLNETELYEAIARKIVKHNNLTAFEYNDIYSVPPPTLTYSTFYENERFGNLVDSLPPLRNITNQGSWDYPAINNQRVNNFITEKNRQYPDNPIFIIVKAMEKRNIDIAQSCNKWVFSPQTEKKVLNFASQGKQVYLIFFVKEFQMFMGIAEYKSMNIGKTFSKPTASIAWKHLTPLAKTQTYHLLNPYNDRKPIHESQDGDVVRQDIGKALMRIYAEFESIKMK